MVRFNMCGRFSLHPPQPPARERPGLAPAVTGKREIHQLPDSERSAELVSYPVSTRVNSQAHDDS